MASGPGATIIVTSLVALIVLKQCLPQFHLLNTLPVILLFDVAAYSIWALVIYPSFLSPLRHIPGPKGGSIFFGQAKQARIDEPRGELARQWMEKIPNEGLLRFRDLLNKEALILTSPAMLKTVLNDNCYDYMKQRSAVNVLRPVLGDGLVLVEGDVHKFQRKHLQASFQGHVIKELYPLFWNKSCELVEMLKDHVSEPEIELGNWFTRATLDIIGVAGFGRDFSSLKNPDEPFVKDYTDLMEPKKEKLFFFLLSLYVPYRYASRIPFWRIPHELRRISTSLFQWGSDMASERRAEFANPKIPQHEKDKRKDILSLLVKSNDFTDAELSHQSLTMLAAGHETTATSLSWCVIMLATHPQIQKDLRDEIRSCLTSPSTPSSAPTNIDTLPLLNAVCSETLRFHPVIHITSRRVARPTRLGNFVLPVDTNVYMVIWAINRNKLFWGEDAEQFNPQRWIDVDDKGNKKVNGHGGVRSTYGLETFLHGPRSCIGQGFARAELKHLLAALVNRFEFELTRAEKTYRPVGMVTSKPVGGTWVKLREVEGW